MGNTVGISLCTFDAVRQAALDERSLLVCTLARDACVIDGTVRIDEEEATINAILKSKTEAQYRVVVYGRNCRDDTVVRKCKQLSALGFKVQCYVGGMFEWLLLQAVYGDDEFGATDEADALLFK